MKHLFLYVVFCSLICCCVACSDDDDDAVTDKIAIATVDCTAVTYSDKIQPIVAASCNLSGCHADGSSNGVYTSYEGLKAIADSGKMKEHVLDEQDMPKSGSLTSEQLGEIKCWLDADAPNN